MGRMWKAFPVGSNRMIPITYVKTIKAFDRRFGGNEPVTVPLDISRVDMTCASCGTEIEAGELFGNGWLEGVGMHCRLCLHIPCGLEAVSISHGVKRSDKLKLITVIASKEVITKFVDELNIELPRGVTAHVQPLFSVEPMGVTQ